MALSTVSGILTRIGMGKLGRLGLEPACRYERDIHYTPLAHGVVAAVLGEALRTRGVLRPRAA